MTGRREFKADENGGGRSDGKARNGADQAAVEHSGDLERSILRTGKSAWTAVCYAEY